MDKYYDDVLPCLESIGTWWTEPDRRLLFCHLLMIFPIHEAYLAELPAARYYDGMEQCSMSQHTIHTALQVFRKVHDGRKCSCAGIRGLEFSFGKLNPRVCYLCPYSGTYKNMMRMDERRFLYHIMMAQDRVLSSYLELEKKDLKDTFLSYFPAYAGDVLIDAYPFWMFAEWFLDKEPGYYKNRLEKSRIELLNKIYADIDQRLPYLRIKSHIEAVLPRYKEEMKKSADKELDEMEQENVAVRPINELMMIRLFRILENRKKYVHKRPEDYITQEKALMIPDLFSNKLLKEQENESRIAEKPLEDPLRQYEEGSFQSPPVLDEVMIAGNHKLLEEVPVILEGDKKTDDEMQSVDIVEGRKDKNQTDSSDDESEEKTIASVVILEKRTAEKKNDVQKAFKNVYQLAEGAIEPLFVYGQGDKNKDDALLKALTSDSDFFAMEPAECNGVLGLLMLNSDGDYIFYSADQYGAKPIRAITDRGAMIYTSNIYRLGRFLSRSKIQRFVLHDVGASTSLSKGMDVLAMEDIDLLQFPECMREYKDTYTNSCVSLDENGKKALDRVEAFASLLCSDGGKPPFAHMESLYRVISSLDYEYLFETGMRPVRRGVFLCLRAFFNDIKMERDELKALYMDVCVELSHKIPFYDGSVLILSVTENGLLLYVMGNRMFIQKAQLYLSSCARRTFAGISTKEHPVTFEQMAQEYIPEEKNTNDKERF